MTKPNLPSSEDGLEELVYWGLINQRGNPQSFDGQEAYRQEAKALIRQRETEAITRFVNGVLHAESNNAMPSIGKSGKYIRSPQSFQDGFEELRQAFSNRLADLSKSEGEV